MALRSAVNTVARRVALATAAQVRIIVHKKWGMEDDVAGDFSWDWTGSSPRSASMNFEALGPKTYLETLSLGTTGSYTDG